MQHNPADSPRRKKDGGHSAVTRGLPSTPRSSSHEPVCCDSGGGSSTQLQADDADHDGGRTRGAAPDSLWSEGVWQIDTESSTYLFDAEAVTISRWTGGAGSIEGVPVEHVDLRRDGEEITVLAASKPTPGESWQLALDLRRDGIVTYRTTTAVRRIRRVS